MITVKAVAASFTRKGNMKKIIIGLSICGIISYGLIQSFGSIIPRNEPLTLVIDHRASELQKFMVKYKCPKPFYITEYINAADKYKLDYRLLASISVQESSCGRHACGDGIRRWGYGSCKGYNFTSVASGIDFVSNALANGNYYRGKTLIQKLKTYNSENPLYYNQIINLMGQMKELPPYQITI